MKIFIIFSEYYIMSNVTGYKVSLLVLYSSTAVEYGHRIPNFSSRVFFASGPVLSVCLSTPGRHVKTFIPDHDYAFERRAL